MLIELDFLKETGKGGAAILSKDRRFRYQLTRYWAEGGSCVVWIMLNPSTADAFENDPTIVRCIGFSKRLGASSLIVVNLFAFRATDPKELLKDPKAVIGDQNERILREMLQHAPRVIAGWGALSNKLWAAATPSRNVIREYAKNLYCLGKTKSGAPRHPLYVKGDAELVPWP